MIRLATVEDMPALLRMSEEFLKEAPYTVPYDEESCIETITDLINKPEDQGILLVSEVDGKVVGMFGGLLVPIYYNKNYKQSYEWWWWMDKEYRHLEEGKNLFINYEDWAQFYGAHHGSACTMSSNKGLVSWFEARGYTNREFFCVKEF